MSATTITIAFDGPALRNGSMDVRDLAPALLAVGSLCEEANRVVNGDRATVSIRVRADFRQGSFEVDLDLVQTLLSQMRDLLAGQTVTAVVNLAGLIGLVGVPVAGLFKVLKWLRGRRPTDIIILQDGRVRIEISSESLETDGKVLDLWRDVAVRKAIANVVRPLGTDGIENFQIRDGRRVVEVIAKEDQVAFALPPADDGEPLTQELRQSAFTIVSLTFKDDNKWRLYDGQNTISAIIADTDFLKRVNDKEESFTKGDILICTVETTQWRTPDSIRTEYRIVEVKEHLTAPLQLSLPLPRSGDDPGRGAGAE